MLPSEPSNGKFELSKDSRELLIVYTIAIVSFTVIFNDRTISFWLKFCFMNLVLAVLALILDGNRILTKIRKGITEWKQTFWRSGIWAFMIYFSLWAVHFYGLVMILTYLDQLDEIYRLLAPENRLFLLISSAIIGPCEEIFWRGYFQQKMEDVQGNPSSALLTSSLLYAFVFISKGNLILFTGLFLAGLIMGFLYKKYRVIIDSALCHGFLYILVLVVFPL
ncbi:MAG: type II CAAX prenyl endopeptidase Rce1 family protein [Candidatus Odinarchaeota archaeon]